MSIDFSTTKPWSDTETVTRDGQSMVKISKFYTWKGKPSNGNYSGKFCREISDHKEKGFQCHPMFMRSGEEMDYRLIGSYEASQDELDSKKAASLSGKAPWVNINYDNAIAACKARNTGAAGSEQYGWEMQNVWDRSGISLLALIELGTPDVQTKIGSGNSSSSTAAVTGSTNAVYRGMHELWGNVWECVDGFRGGGLTTSARVFDNQGNHTYVDTGETLAAGGWVKDVCTASGTGFDLSDGFFPSSVDSAKENGTFGDYFWSPTLKDYVAYTGGIGADGGAVGLFAWGLHCNSGNSGQAVTFRLAKWDI